MVMEEKGLLGRVRGAREVGVVVGTGLMEEKGGGGNEKGGRESGGKMERMWGVG
jgi:hypothetical protein